MMTRRMKLLAGLLPALLAGRLILAASVDHLRCEDLEGPQGIDAEPPRLGWLLESRRPDERQTAFQVLVASSRDKLDDDQGDLWDSGKVTSDQSIQVDYAGRALTSWQACFWKVRVWDAAGEVSGWSRPAEWSMGLLTPEDWGAARWIGLDGETVVSHLSHADWIACPATTNTDTTPATNYFRRVVTLPAGRLVKSATFQYTGDDEGRGWIDDFDLGARNNYHTVKFNDITTRLNPGETYVFGLTGYHKTAGHPAAVVGSLEIEFTQGPPMIVPTDGGWKASPEAADGWLGTNFDDSAWRSAQDLGPVGMARWGPVRSAEPRGLPARQLRKEFTAAHRVARAMVACSGLGLSELYLNGSKAGDAALSPAFAQYNRRDYYVTYDVTRQIRRGVNALGVILGNGRFYADRSRVYAGTEDFGFPKLKLNLRLEYTDGTTEEIVSDGSWKLTTNGPITANNDYDGEDYDARRELPGWASPGFDDSAWQSAECVAGPGGTLSAQMLEPIRVTDTLRPVSLRELRPGVFIYDLGQNISGWCRLRVSGPAGTRVQLRHAETLQPDGSLYLANLRGARATDSYILKGRGREEWEPRFTSHGFRYVEMTGYPGRPTLRSLAGRVVNDDLPRAGSFTCSNELINRIYTAITWGTRGNYRSLPTDCPQRDERQGWLGDRAEESRGESYLFDNSDLYAKWLRDMADAQRPDGSVPDVAPAFWPIYSDNVVWPSSSIIIPQMLEDQFGDTRTVARHYASMKLWMDHMAGWLTNGLISRDSYGDWCVPPEDPREIHSKDPARITDKTLLATAFFYHDSQLMSGYARQLGRLVEASDFEAQAAAIKVAFNRAFLDRRRGQYSNGTQTSCVLPLAFGLAPEDCRAAIFQHLVNKIEQETGGHVGTGLVGGQYLCRVLNDNGRPDLVYTMASQKTYPGWGYMIEHGATTIWELWNGNTADPTMNSGNHVMLIGDLVVWLNEDLAGIKPDPARPAFQHILMNPAPVNGLTFVKASHRSPYGWITSEWRRRDGTFDWRIQIPPNTTATAGVPASSLAAVTASGETPLRFEHGRVIYELGSGCHHFISR